MKTSYAKFIGSLLFAIGVLSVSFVHAATSSDMKWVQAPASLPAGAKLAILTGDLGKPGPLAFRLKLPAGYQIKPQSSPALDRLTVVYGTFNFGSGQTFDKARTIPLSTGYEHWLDKSPYFGWTTEETVIQIEGAGPWTVSYVNPADDPRKQY
jgi:hypothetical protein